MSRRCPTCNNYSRVSVFSTDYKVPDGWPLPQRINWYRCVMCGMLYGDGDFDQEMYNQYYQDYYGYGINSADVLERLQDIAYEIHRGRNVKDRIVDFGGSGDDGRSIVCDWLEEHGFEFVYNVNAGEPVPECDVLLASHVLEHVYDMEATMRKITDALDSNGLLIVDGPDATGLVRRWEMPMLDFHTKHINHFRLIDYLKLMDNYGFTLIKILNYTDIRSNQNAPCYRMWFKRFDMADESRLHVQTNTDEKLEKLRAIDEPVNVWGLGDIAWSLLSQVDLNVVNYIDNDPAMKGATMYGEPIVDAPDNNAPIVIVAQGQKSKLLKRIKDNYPNKVIVI